MMIMIMLRFVQFCLQNKGHITAELNLQSSLNIACFLTTFRSINTMRFRQLLCEKEDIKTE